MIGLIDTDGYCAEWTFPAEPGAVRTARAVVRGQLREWDLESLGDITALLVSELVTNSLRHATGPIGVRLVRPEGGPDAPGGQQPAGERDAPGGPGRPGGPGSLRVEVSDPLPDPPRERAADTSDESGRGLQLVAGSCRRWGTWPADTGKTVWFELAVPD
ncbi:ATP-binding protein [Streptomyces sp. NPDC127038]|uniref:ATP-binding protein n=1 Tax=Streptomyces sp. NPDC127038 TaxID=3347114 RepID=UPI00364B19A0